MIQTALRSRRAGPAQSCLVAPAPESIQRGIAAGHGGLEAEIVSGQSTVTSAWASSPLKLLVPRARGESVWAYLSSFGGGMVAGDETNLSVRLGENVRCFISTQASTKVYRNSNQRACGHKLNAALGNGSLLVLAPDSVQCFAGSNYAQRQEFQLQDGAALVMVDWFSSGRVARGERWAFTRFQSRNDVFVNGERLFADSLLLDPDDGPLDGPHRMGRFNCLALIALVGAALCEPIGESLAEIGAQPVAKRASLVYTASPISNGALLRFAGERVEDVRHEIRRHLHFLDGLLGDDPFTRKW